MGCGPPGMSNGNGQDEMMREHGNPRMCERLLVWVGGKADTGSGH